MLMQPAFERFKNDVQDSVGVQVKVADHRLDDFECIRRAGNGEILIEFSDQLGIAFTLFSK